MADESVTGALKRKKDEKHRRRDPRSWDNIKKATLLMTDEQKTSYITKMYNEMYNENRTLSVNLQTREKQLQAMQKDNDRDRSELTKSILTRGKLESLCRELQKQSRLIKEENVARIKEEEDRRREVANTFTERLNALTNLITESKDKSNKVKEENQNMTEKLTELYEQYQQRESHLETVTKQLDLQKKLAETQAKKTEIEHEAERQTYIAEKKALVMQLEQYERELVLLQEKNRSLEAQVDLYKSQYSDFETTMTKSNKVFDTFKEEMSRMNKQLHTLETERNDLKRRWQSSVNSLIVLSEQHMALTNEQNALEKRLVMLQKLCRQLQEDRSAFIKQLKENNIEPIVPSVKNTENCEKDASEPNLETSKSTQRALKLKQELGKVKEAAGLNILGRCPIFEEEGTKDLSNRLKKDLESIQKQIEVFDAEMEEYLENDSDCNDQKRFKAAAERQQGEGDNNPVAGPSGVSSKAKVAVTVESSTQAGPSTSDASSQYEDIPLLHRAHAATNLIREQVPSQVSPKSNSNGPHYSGSKTTLEELSSVESIGDLTNDSNDELMSFVDNEQIVIENTSSSSDDEYSLMSRSVLFENEEEEVQQDDRDRKSEVMDVEDSTSSSSYDSEDNLMPIPLPELRKKEVNNYDKKEIEVTNLYVRSSSSSDNDDTMMPRPLLPEVQEVEGKKDDENGVEVINVEGSTSSSSDIDRDTTMSRALPEIEEEKVKKDDENRIEVINVEGSTSSSSDDKDTTMSRPLPVTEEEKGNKDDKNKIEVINVEGASSSFSKNDEHTPMSRPLLPETEEEEVKKDDRKQGD